MARFRDSLKPKIISKTERLSTRLARETRASINASDERRQYLANLRRNAKLTGFISPTSSSIRNKQRMVVDFVKRMVEAFQTYLRRRGRIMVNFGRQQANRFRTALNNLIERTRERVVGLARRVIDNRITPQEFKDSLTRTIRRLHISSVFLGIRGAANITGNITEMLIAKVSRELNLVGQFAQWVNDIKDAGEELAATVVDKILRVAGSFINAARSTFSQAEAQLVDDIYNRNEEEVVEEMRVLDEGTDRHCNPCVSWSGFWSAIGTLPAINTLQCGDNCRCTKVYRVIQQGQEVTEFT